MSPSEIPTIRPSLHPTTTEPSANPVHAPSKQPFYAPSEAPVSGPTPWETVIYVPGVTDIVLQEKECETGILKRKSEIDFDGIWFTANSSNSNQFLSESIYNYSSVEGARATYYMQFEGTHESGTYEVLSSWETLARNNEETPYYIYHSAQTTLVVVDQTKNGNNWNQNSGESNFVRSNLIVWEGILFEKMCMGWVILFFWVGTFHFDASSDEQIVIETSYPHEKFSVAENLLLIKHKGPARRIPSNETVKVGEFWSFQTKVTEAGMYQVLIFWSTTTDADVGNVTILLFLRNLEFR